MLRYSFIVLAVFATLASAVLSVWFPWLIPAVLLLAALVALGIWDLVQPGHSILRNYPIIGHMRWLFEGIRPEIRQYLIESDRDEEPFSRDERSLIYQRAKGEEDKRPFGTRERVYDPGYAWLTHSVAGQHLADSDFRIRVGGRDCKQPYDASLYNISAMSFGALSGNAILALNTGAKAGNFVHDTGEGGISKYHREGNGDIIYEIGTGYFGCRTADGQFDPDKFAEQAVSPQVKMIEVKLSQGAKPGHGGMLPAAKISPEIAEARGVPMDRDCISPPYHSAFHTPMELCEFLDRLRDLSGGKPVGFKLCVGHRREFMCIVKAMRKSGIVPDFIVVDGTEGGTGAAPLEFANHIGMPLIEGLTFVHNTLRGAGLRDQIRIGASGKLVTAFDIVRACALGADWCNSARGFMFAIGCIQAQACHTNRCPTGVATQDPLRQRALVPADKALRVARFHRNTLRAVADIVGAAGLRKPAELKPHHFNMRLNSGETVTGDKAYPELPIGCLVDDTCKNDEYSRRWTAASADTFNREDGR
ncbi:FMN-binding glutamate synthase family protein [Hwanghaeella sp.]|uniref:FMN-binding glutamate synthase family protein n=1 Tax=Hwanghaeella sp. TaxID=2605943 RepID=UPI003CCB8DAC